MSYINSLQNRGGLTSEQKKELANKQADKLQAEAERLTETAGTRKYLRVRAENLKREARAIRNVTTWYDDPKRYKQSKKGGTPTGKFKDPRPVGVEKGKEDIPLSSRSEKTGTIILYSKKDNDSVLVSQTQSNIRTLKKITEQENAKDEIIDRGDYIEKLLKSQGKTVTRRGGDIIAVDGDRKTTVTAQGDIVVTPVSAKVRGDVLKESLGRKRFFIEKKPRAIKEKEKVKELGFFGKIQNKFDTTVSQREQEIASAVDYAPALAVISYAGLSTFKSVAKYVVHPVETVKNIYKSTALPGGEANKPNVFFPFATMSTEQQTETGKAFARDPIGATFGLFGDLLVFKGASEGVTAVVKGGATPKIIGTQAEELVTLRVPGGSVTKVSAKTTVKVGKQLYEVIGEGLETTTPGKGVGEQYFKGRYQYESGKTTASQVTAGTKYNLNKKQTGTIGQSVIKVVDKGKIKYGRGDFATISEEYYNVNGLSTSRYVTEAYSSEPIKTTSRAKVLESETSKKSFEAGVIKEQAKFSEGVIEKTLSKGKSKILQEGAVKDFEGLVNDDYVYVKEPRKGLPEPPIKTGKKGTGATDSGGSSTGTILRSDKGVTAVSSLKEGAKAVAKVKSQKISYDPTPAPYSIGPKLSAVKTSSVPRSKQETTPVTTPRKAQVIIIKSASTTKQGTGEKIAQETSQDKKTKVGQASGTRLTQASITDVTTEQTQEQQQEQQQEQLTRVTPVLKIAQRGPASTVITPITRGPPTGFTAFKSSIPSSTINKKDYKIFVKRRGSFQLIGTAESPEQAYKEGSLAVDMSASASFKVESMGANESLTAFGSRYLNPKKFRKSKSDPGVFVERRAFRISTPGEKREITFLGLQVLRNTKRKKRFNVFGG